MSRSQRGSVRGAIAWLVVAMPFASSATASEPPRFGLAAGAEIVAADSSSPAAEVVSANGRFALVATSIEAPLACGDDTIFANGFD
jgi:hypothetical protein